MPGPADGVTHRRTRIEDTSGTKESLILPHCPKGRGGTPTLIMAEVGLPIALTVQLGGAAVHEATALWDVRTAVDSDREVKPLEQHIHSFLESLARGGRGDKDAWRLVPRRRPLSPGYLSGIGAAIGACVLLPYGEELLRCARTARARKKLSRKGR